MAGTPQYDLFISYAQADYEWVEGYLQNALLQSGVHFHSERAFALGVPRIKEFENAIQRSHRTLLVISPAYLLDGFNLFVDLLSQSYGLESQTWPVIPLVYQSVQLPPRLNALVKLDATNPDQWESVIVRLCTDLQHPVPTVSTKPACPYPGMVPFSEADGDRFFGRDQEIEELLDKLRLQGFVTVIGPSGSGKSSLVFAGLVPALYRTGLFNSDIWKICSIRPGETPLTQLKTLLNTDLENPAQALSQALATQANAKRLLLIVDQFEEVFTFTSAEAIQFQQALLKLAGIPDIYLILTVRADFYADLMTSPLWRKIQTNRVEVTPLDEVRLRQAILKPAENVGVLVEPALLERLVTDAVGEPGVLPLVQETLVLLWERVERRFLPLRAYEALMLTRKAYGTLGSGRRTGLQVAIARRADAALANLDVDPENIPRRIFLRLIQFGEGRADTRRQQPVEALRITNDDPTLFNNILNHLAECRLLTLTSDEKKQTVQVDIAHEALISGWPTLQQWIAERKEAEQTRRRLEAKAQDWIKLNKKGGLLDTAELEEVKRLKSSNATEFELSLPSYELIKASRQAAQVRKIILGAYIVFITGFAIIAGVQWRNAEIGQIKALSESSKAKFTSNRFSFDALLDALKASTRLKHPLLQVGLPWSNAETQLKADVMTALTESVFWVKEKNRLEGHDGVISSLSFSPDQQTIASAGGDGTIKLWKHDGELIGTLLEGHKDTVRSVSFNSDGQILASGGNDGIVRLWKKKDGTWKEDENWRKTLSVSKEKVKQVFVVSFSRDGKLLAAAGEGGTVKIWQLDGELIASLTDPNDPYEVYSISFNPISPIIATSYGRKVKLWRWKDGKGEVIQVFDEHKDEVTSVDFSPDGQILASGSLDGTVKLWQLNGNQKALITTLTDELCDEQNQNVCGVRSVSFSRDGNLASGGQNNTVKLWQHDGDWKKKKSPTTLVGHSNYVTSVTFSKDGQTLGSASNDNTIKLWELKNQRLTVLNNDTPTNSVSFCPNINTPILAAANSDTVKLWRLDQSLMNTLSVKEKKGHPQSTIQKVTFSQEENCRLLASASSNEDQTGEINVWQLNEDGTPLPSPPIFGKGEKDFTDVSFSPNNSMIATADRDEIKLWQLDRNRLKATLITEPMLKRHKGIAYAVSFSPNGQMLASSGIDGFVNLYKTDGTLIKFFKELQENPYPLLDVKFSPDNKMIAATSKDGSVKLWKIDGTSVKLIKSLSQNSSPVTKVSFNPKKSYLASGNERGQIFLWKLDGTFISELPGHSKYVMSLSFSPNGTILASGSDDNSTILWNLDDPSDDDLSLDHWLTLGCNWMQDYLKTHPHTPDTSDLHICRE
ncbi:TIR domain-containing protein [Scytonema hofmannii FACHB-248]|uniref:TIR domain-containing protein n=1 Tax=Scytonema hofmannii FACHB-248 TaxID=1842502 RepID=A0ABR8GU92_9CYAN|nr:MULTISPECIES: TIR domain-containing protein [Nostocales]MBD2607035.1 TIR domain-containing protein [Scytonema hofmannii FACHB-248]